VGLRLKHNNGYQSTGPMLKVDWSDFKKSIGPMKKATGPGDGVTWKGKNYHRNIH
jgi:hypothetical protein